MAKIALFVKPASEECEKVEEFLRAKQVEYARIDVTESRDALRALIRHAGTAMVPTVVAYGEVMVGFDELRFEELMTGLQERADAFIAEDESQKKQVADSAVSLRELIGPDDDQGTREVDGIEPLPDEE